MVEVKLLHLRASVVWDVGWCVYIMYDQHLWCGDLLEDRVDGGMY